MHACVLPKSGESENIDGLLQAVLMGEVRFIAMYLALGFAPRMIVAQGDCGPDVVAIHNGKGDVRTLADWKAIRLEVAKEPRKLEGDEWFQRAFLLAQGVSRTRNC